MTVRLTVRVQPGARVKGGTREGSAVARLADGTLRLKVAAPAVDGRANAAVVEALARILGVKARQVAIVRGHASRLKVVEVEALDAALAEARIAAAIGNEDPDAE